MKSEWVKERFKGLEKALKLQAREYERRLKDLNGEAGRLRSIQAEYIPREVFDRTINDIRDRLEKLSAWKTSQEGKSQLLQFVPWALTIVSLIFMYLMYTKK